jgi:hypothetical protein
MDFLTSLYNMIRSTPLLLVPVSSQTGDWNYSQSNGIHYTPSGLYYDQSHLNQALINNRRAVTIKLRLISALIICSLLATCHIQWLNNRAIYQYLIINRIQSFKRKIRYVLEFQTIAIGVK